MVFQVWERPREPAEAGEMPGNAGERPGAPGRAPESSVELWRALESSGELCSPTEQRGAT